MDPSFRQSVRSLVAAVVMAAAAYSIAAPSALGFEAPESTPVSRHRQEASSRAAPPTQLAALTPLNPPSSLPRGSTFTSTAAPIEAPGVPGLAMLVAAGLWVLVLVRRRWPARS